MGNGYCPYCGEKIERDDQKFCTNCGARISSRSENIETENTFGSAFDAVTSDSFGSTQTYAPKLGMKWYKFVVYVLLFCSMISTLYSAYRQFTGGEYALSSILYRSPNGEALQEKFSDFIGFIDIAYGVYCVLFLFYLIFTWYSLKKFKKNGPKLFICTYIISWAVETVFCVIALVFGAIFTSVIGQIVSDGILTLLWVLINRSYFEKRKHLFVN